MCVALGYDVYDYRPDSSAGYPFVDLGEQFNQTTPDSKDTMRTDTQITIHVWHNDWRRRGTLTSMMNDIEDGVKRLKKTTRLSLRLNAVNSQVLTDNATNTPLLHGVIEADITYQ